ncbi:MAG: PAS domain-containing sensor histidine kinase [Gammaproteobacteria bacterium]|nr:MAG: PAS domain-containing sensor histidine kinase [Gammaproteobacteria bacterium]
MVTTLQLFYLIFAVLVLLLALSLFYYWSLSGLRKRIIDIREGHLLPVDTPAISPPFVRGLLDEYNITNARLDSIFKVLENCQTNVGKERDKIDAIIQSLTSAILTVSNDLNINMTNQLANDFFAKDGVTLIGINLFDLIQFREVDRNILRDSFLYKKPIRNLEISLDIKSRPRWFSLNLVFLSRSKDELEAIITLLDISENHELQKTLASREKLVAMGQLASGIAHELNTPLGSILGYTQLLKKDLLEQGQSHEYVTIVEDETRRCTKIINDLLSFASQEQCDVETCEINELLVNISDTFLKCRMQRYGIEINLELQPDLPMVEGGCGQLEIVLTNLIINAIQCLDGVESPFINLCSWQQGKQYVYISVEDNGPGVPEEIRRNIFDPFFTTKDVGEGSGLGLSISQALLSKRGAFIKYDAEYVDGARFIIGLPLIDEQRDKK